MFYKTLEKSPSLHMQIGKFTSVRGSVQVYPVCGGDFGFIFVVLTRGERNASYCHRPICENDARKSA